MTLYTSSKYKSFLMIKRNQGEFDVGVDFCIGDPNVNFRAAAKSYETIEEVGKELHLIQLATF